MKFFNYIIILLIWICNFIYSQTGYLRGTISGKDSVLTGANILIMNSELGAVSGPGGKYLIENIPAGKQKVRISAVGYKTDTLEIQILSGKTSELNCRLSETVVEVSEIEVFGNRTQQQKDTRTSLLSLKPATAGVLPGDVQDVMRALQSLPGVLAVNDFSSQLIIRGSGPDQNLIVMDDIEVFNPYRLYGVISMFNPEAVSDISLITGGFPARYGDRLSAVLDVTNREGTKSRFFKGNLNVSIVDANLVIEGKNPFNISGSWLINSRRTYYDLIIEPFVKKAGLVDDNTAFPNFYDFQTKLSFGPFNGHRFLINGIFSRDGVNIISGNNRSTPDSVSVNDKTKNDLAGIAWHYSPSEKFLSKFIVSWYRNAGDSGIEAELLDPSIERDRFQNALPDTLAPYLINFGVTSTYGFRKYSFDDKIFIGWNENEFEAGAGFDLMQTRIDLQFNVNPELYAILEGNPNFTAVLNNLADISNYSRSRFYVQNNFKLSSALYIQPGIRFDYYSILKKYYFAPRISLSYAFNNVTTLRAAWGIYYQSPGYEKIRDENVLLDLSNRYAGDLKAEKATHYILSIERWLNEEWRVKFETYYKKFDNLIVPEVVTGTGFHTEPVPGKDPRFIDGWTRPVPVPIDSITQVPVNNSFGEAFGLEFLLEKKNIFGLNKFSGWLSYSLAWANRYEDGFIIPFRFDQRNTLNVVLDYNLNDWFTVGLRFQFGSGFPYSKPVGIKPRIILVDENADGKSDTPEIVTGRNYADPATGPVVLYDIDFGSRNNYYAARKPDYQRLDLRFTFAADIWNYNWNFYIDIINVYNRTNVLTYDYFVTPDLKLGQKATGMFPILPTFGFNVKL
jgi:hypothetical protein